MNNSKLLILGLIAGLMVIWSIFAARAPQKQRTEPEGPIYLIQGLDPADIDAIVLETGGSAITLKRKNKGFVAADKSDYPAVADKINDLIKNCLDIRTHELYTDNPANHKNLGVTKEHAKNIIKFLRPDSTIMIGIIIGNVKDQGRGSFVRLISSDEVYLTLQRPRIKSEAMDYIDAELISINDKDIESVTVGGQNGYTLKTGKNSDGIVLKNLPAGKKLKENAAKKVFSALANLRFDDVQKAATEKDALNFNKKYVCRLKNSTVYTITIAQKNEETFVKCKTKFTDTTPITAKEVKDANEAELKAKEAKLLAHEKANKFTAKHAKWVYRIDRHHLTDELSDLIEDEEKPQQEK